MSVRDQGVGGSNPLSPTIFFNNLQPFSSRLKIQCRRFCSGESLQVQQVDGQTGAPIDSAKKTETRHLCGDTCAEWKYLYAPEQNRPSTLHPLVDRPVTHPGNVQVWREPSGRTSPLCCPNCARELAYCGSPDRLQSFSSLNLFDRSGPIVFPRINVQNRGACSS